MVDILQNSENQQEILIAEYKSQLMRMSELVLSDRLPDYPIDALFIHARSGSDEGGIIELAAELLLSGKVKNIVVTGSDGQGMGSSPLADYQRGLDKSTAWAGKADWAKKLDEKGVDVGEFVYFSTPAFHTSGENDVYTDIAKELGWHGAATLTHPHQLLRACMGQLKSIQKLETVDPSYKLDVYNVYPKETAWEEIVAGSQGKDPKPRRVHASDEYLRIVKYTGQGSLATFDDLIKYWKNRGGVNLEDIMKNRSRISSQPEHIKNVEVINKAIDSLGPEVYDPLFTTK